MAKKSAPRHRSFTIPLAPVVGLAAGLAVPAQDALNGNFKGAFEGLSRNYTGYDPASKQWHMGYLKQGAAPLLAGIIVHKVASMLGVNRAIGAAGVPWLRV